MGRLIVCVLMAAVVVGCEAGDGLELAGEGGDITAADATEPQEDTGETAVAPDSEAPDTPSPPDAVVEIVGPDGPDEAGCQPGDGCFGEPCGDAEDCLSGICAMHMGDQVCSKTCDAACPDGFSCQLASGSTDGQSVCVSDYPHLCLPCESSDGCGGDTPQACVRYPDGLSFCGGACDLATACPEGYDCQQVENTSGVETFQCVATAGICECSEIAIDMGLSTWCERANGHGSCHGIAVCTVNGLEPCDAPEPTPEICDGLDNNCDGVIDDVVCNDENSCSIGTCLGADGCGQEPLDGGECLDGDACTIGDHCEAGVCVGTPIDCDDGNSCTIDGCSELGGCSFDAAAGPCDDEDVCTLGDFCDAGACVGGVTLDCDDQNPCTDDACSATGCVNAPSEEVCDDQNACTTASVCEQGACVATEVLGCDDQNGCTIDACDTKTGCVHAPHTLPCDDGDLCTLGDACSAGACQSGVGNMACDDQNPCTDDACDTSLGCVHTPNANSCNDGSDCTVMDTCQAGQCLGTGSLECDDDNPCTIDICLANGGCDHEVKFGGCEDGDPCTLGDQCVNGLCSSGEPLSCDDMNPCTDDACEGDFGCVFEPNTADCDDGNKCTSADGCWNGTCVAMGAVTCDDENPCTLDSCKPLEGCVHGPIEAPCSDGDPCTVSDTCSDGSCESGPPLNCEDQNPCTTGVCLAGSCIFSDQVGACDDQNACTLGGVCEEGFCQPGSGLDCDDGNLCTSNGCDPATGCTTASNTNPCSDDSACTVGDSCSGGSCVAGDPLSCDDANECTVDSCDPGGGCGHADLEDEAPCGGGDTQWCQAGACVAKEFCGDGIEQAGEECDDGNANDEDDCNSACEYIGSTVMAWVDETTGSCPGTAHLRFAEIAAAMPTGPTTVTIEANQVNPLPNFGSWSGTFHNQSCVRQWLTVIGNKDTTSYDSWDPAVCQATEAGGTAYFFVCKSDGASSPQIAIYPASSSPAENMKLYMLDRTGAWCDLAGVDNRPGFDAQVTNSNTFGVAGDSVTFTW